MEAQAIERSTNEVLRVNKSQPKHSSKESLVISPERKELIITELKDLIEEIKKLEALDPDL